MGASSSQNKNEKLNLNFSLVNEAKVRLGDYLNKRNSEIFFEKAEKSICEIITKNLYGSGFFCKIKYPNKSNENEIYCLITNHHVITKATLMNKENIEIIFNYKYLKISLNLYRRIWTNEEIDFTCIEILEEDNIIDKINPFEIDDNCYDLNYNLKEYENRGIAIPKKIINEEIELSTGIFYFIENEKFKDIFFHDCNTEPGFSGGPIILINNTKIIGIHKGYEKNNKKNVGIYFKEIIEYINEENKIYGKNLINFILDIEDLKENEIIIFNHKKKNEKEIKGNLIAFLENKRINMINEQNKWKI